MIFSNPPLVELIAELRWGAPAMVLPIAGSGGVMATGPTPITASNRAEELFMRFGAKVAEDGFSQFERIVPAGFPLMPFQPVYRYRKGTTTNETSLYQLGPGLFTANITPPYQSWEHFRPVVGAGVAKLLECRDNAEMDEPFGAALLRYIDAFGPEFTQGLSIFDFLTEKLGFHASLPKGINDLADRSQPIQPTLQFGVRLNGGLFMNIAAGEGVVDGRSALILDTTVSTTTVVGCTLEEVMRAFDDAHNVIRTAFISITKPIETLMQPTVGAGS